MKPTVAPLQGTFQTWRCGICGHESYSSDEITACLRSHTPAELAFAYKTGRYVGMRE